VPVSALPGPGKDPAAFQRDETACRIAAASAAYPGERISDGQSAPASGNVNAVWQAYFAAFGKCEAARGNLVQPVPWAVAYQLYLGFGYPALYPPAFGLAYAPAYGYPPAAWYPSAGGSP